MYDLHFLRCKPCERRKLAKWWARNQWDSLISRLLNQQYWWCACDRVVLLQTKRLSHLLIISPFKFRFTIQTVLSCFFRFFSCLRMLIIFKNNTFESTLSLLWVQIKRPFIWKIYWAVWKNDFKRFEDSLAKSTKLSPYSSLRINPVAKLASKAVAHHEFYSSMKPFAVTLDKQHRNRKNQFLAYWSLLNDRPPDKQWNKQISHNIQMAISSLKKVQSLNFKLCSLQRAAIIEIVNVFLADTPLGRKKRKKLEERS